MPNPYPAEFEAGGVDKLVGEIVFSDPDNQPGGGGGLPTGWTESGDPATVATHGGGIELAAGSISGSDGGTHSWQAIAVGGAATVAVNDDDSASVAMAVTTGVTSQPSAGPSCFKAQGGGGGVVAALDCGGLYIIGLPTADPGVPGALYTTGGAVLVSSG